MENQDIDRNEAATPYKLQKARDKGQVGKSVDAVGAAVFTIAAAYLYWKGWDGLVALFRINHALLVQMAHVQPGAAALWQITASMVTQAFLLLAPFLGIVVLSALVANLAQTGPLLSLDPVKPDFSRLNPATGFKRMFSARTVFDAVRATIKLVLLCWVLWIALRDLLPQFFHLAAWSHAHLARMVTQDIAASGLKIAVLLCLIAAVDYGFTRHEFAKKMRMSRRELKDEHKHREGDPRIRARLRELRREALRRSQAVRNTAAADVVLTNPTHVAVALRYEHGRMHSPQLVAKGAGTLAAAMRKIAARHRVPVIQNPPLAREIYRSLEVDHFIPPELFGRVARIMVWVFAMREARST